MTAALDFDYVVEEPNGTTPFLTLVPEPDNPLFGEPGSKQLLAEYFNGYRFESYLYGTLTKGGW